MAETQVSTRQLNLTGFPKDIGIILTPAGEAIATGAVDYEWVASEGGTFTDFLLTVKTAPTGAPIDFDVKNNGTSIFTTRITIDATETSSDTATTAFVINTASFSRGDRISFEFVGVGSTVAGADAQITLYYLRA